MTTFIALVFKFLVSVEFFGLQLNYRDTPVKYLLADVKHKILLLPIYSKNKPSADYAQILGQK